MPPKPTPGIVQTLLLYFLTGERKNDISLQNVGQSYKIALQHYAMEKAHAKLDDWKY